MTNPFGNRSEITAAEYREYVSSGGLTIFLPPEDDTPPDDPRRVSMPKVRENAFRDSVVALAHYRGWRVYWTWNSKHSPAGFPDLTLCRERVVYAELKVKPNKPTKAQMGWLDALSAAGQETHIWYPEDFDWIEEVLA